MKTIESLTEAEIAQLSKLPERWKWTKFEEITENFDGNRKPLSSKFRESFKGEYPYYGACDIIDYVREYIFDGEYLLIGEDGANLLSKAKPLAFSVKGKFWVNNHAHILKATNDVNQKYLEFQFNALQINKYVTGTAQPKLNQSNLNKISIAICPLPEQRAIVSKIEQLFSELDNGISNLKLAREQLKVYRQAVLKKAFEGELTKKWRKENKYGDIEQLLFKVNKERLEYFQNKGKKIKQVTPISEEEISELVPVPKNWKRVRLNDLSFLITDGKHGDCKNHENSGYFFISAKDIFDGKINYADARQIQKEDFEEVHKRTDLQPDDVLVTNAGTIGRIAIATANDKTSKTTFQKSVAIIKKPNSLIDSKYLAYHLENDVENIKLVSKGTAQKNLLLGTMSELIISICPVKEQQAIVQEIETRLSVCDKIEQDIETNLEKAEALRQSILKKAFEGKLLNEKELAEVRGAEDWESAEVLLEKIKAEKTRNGNKGKQETEKLKSIIQKDKEIIQQATLQAFEKINK